MQELKTEYLCELVVYFDWKEILNLGTTPHDIRRIAKVTGGAFEGPRLRGIVLPGGGDWFIRRPDGVVELDVRAVLRTEGNDLIYTYYRGINDAKPEVGARIFSGEDVDPSEYYFRTTPVFETASVKYGWLNRIVAVSLGRIIPAGVAYRTYTVL
jgi:hypothetical protein